MMKLQFKSFATRLSIYIISFTIIVFLGVMVIFYSYNRKEVTEHSVQYTHGLLRNMATQIHGVLMTVEATMRHSEWMIEENISNPDSLRRIVTAVVRNNDLIVGSGIAFNPYYYKEKGYYFMPYAFMDGERITYQILGDKTYDYPCVDWFLIPKLLKKSYWSEPYYDQGGGNIIMSAYSVPLFDSNGEVYAVFTANISLAQFTDMVDELKPYESSRSFMVSRTGSYLTHPDRNKIMNETIFVNAFESDDENYVYLAKEMIAGNTGTVRFENDGKESYAFYTSIPDIGWSVCNVCPGNVILHELDSTSRRIFILFIIGMLLSFLASYFTIKKIVRPLEDFSKSARLIATGRFDTELPEVKSDDEMKDLHDSLAFMQHSLSEYVTELRATTATKERIESELYIAHEIQMGMIPKTFPPFPERCDVDLHAILKPAKEVGGDLYDFFLDDGKLYFAVGDVSGKGVPASLFMAITRSLFHTISSQMLSPRAVMNSMNNAISQSNETNMFVTLFIAVLDLESGVLKYCNAGHNNPILIQPDGAASYMEVKRNLFVGVMEGFEYEDEEITLGKGSKLFLYTDGITEAENEAKELYSDERLLQTVSRYSSLDVRCLIDKVSESVAVHVQEAEQSDDITMLVIHYKPNKHGERD